MPVIINGSTGISGVDGSAGTPAFQGSDANTGIRFGTDIVSLVTGGSDRLYINSSGQIGIASSSPQTALQLGNYSGNNQIAITSGSASGTGAIYFGDGTGADLYRGYIQYYHVNDSIEIGTAATGRLTIDSSGRVGIGTTTVDEKLHVSGTGDIKTKIATTSTGVNANAAVQLDAGTEGNWVIQTGNAVSDGLRFYDAQAGSERARIDSSGRLLVGTSTGYNDARLQVVGNTGGDPGRIDIRRNADNPVANSEIGTIRFSDLNGASGQYATIQCFADAASTSSGDLPGRLVFNTTSDGSASPTERARLTSAGYFKASPDNSYNSSAGSYHEFNNNLSNNAAIISRVNNASYTDHAYVIACYRSANSAYSFIRCDSGDGATNPFNDTEFRLRGDGNGTCDGAWTGGGADYAEYFEWADSNPNEEDRRGISVVLDGDKIRKAAAGEEPIGVISGNPSVVGDAAWNKWSGKYLRDDFGTYIQEDYEVVNDEGETVVQQRRKLNPAYDPDVEYIPREDRAEWDCVGLMGKLRIRKGQVTGARWIKMRDISATVEEWLVR